MTGVIELPELIAHQLRRERWGDMPEWEETLKRLPEIDPLHIDLSNGVQIGDISLMDKGRRLALQATLMGLHPWRKGPYNLFGMHLDTEWRSDWKWDRVLPHLAPSKDEPSSMLAAAMAITAGACSAPVLSAL